MLHKMVFSSTFSYVSSWTTSTVEDVDKSLCKDIPFSIKDELIIKMADHVMYYKVFDFVC
jgi:hypothetical protein